MSNLTERIIEKIKNRQLDMRPRWHFVLRAVLVLIAVASALALLAFLVSWLVFILRASGVWFLPDFGPRGWRPFFAYFPYLPVLGAILLLLLLVVLAERWPTVYRHPALYAVLVIVAVVAGASFILGRTRVHRGLYERAYKSPPPVVGSFYRRYGRPSLEDAYIGSVQLDADNNIANGSFDITTPVGERFLIITNKNTRLPFGGLPALGETVMIMGDRQATTVTAFGVRPVGERDGFYGHRFIMMRRPPPPR